MDREDLAKRIFLVKEELGDLAVQFNRAYYNSEFVDGDSKVWSAVVKASDALCDAQAFVDKHYFGM